MAITPPAAAASASPAWAAFEEMWSTVSAYRATVAISERKGTEVKSAVFDYAFSKPSTATVRVVSGENAGVTVVWSGGDTVVAHRGSGLAALFKKTLALHDPQVTTVRGSSIDQLSFGAFITHSLETPGVVSQEPGPTILNTPTEAVTFVPTSPAVDDGLTREVIDLSVTTNVPLRVVGYDQDTVVREIDLSNIVLERQP